MRAERLFTRLPYPAKVAAATTNGLRLRHWRFSRETDDLVTAALERDRWDSSRWDTWHREHLARTLDRAATSVPYYRQRWQARRARGDHRGWDSLENWPVLTKEEVRLDPRAFLADDHSGGRRFPEHTSGSTGTPLSLWWSRAAVRDWYALCEARGRRWYGVSRHDRWGILGGRVIAPFGRERPPFWVWNGGLQQLYLSSYHVGRASAAAYAEALERHRVVYLLGYPSALALLAHSLIDLGVTPAAVKVVVANAEPLGDDQRAAIETAFACPVRDTYGAAELVCGASECEHGRLHLWPEVGVVETLPSEGSQERRLIATGLLNDAMPLVRYDTGDLVGATESGAPCSCGRTLPSMGHVHGRSDDLIIAANGRPIGRLDPVFKADLSIVEAQIVQDHPGALRVRLVPGAGFGPGQEADLIGRLRDRVGTMSIAVELVDSIERDGNGKFRAVVSRVGGTHQS